MALGDILVCLGGQQGALGGVLVSQVGGWRKDADEVALGDAGWHWVTSWPPGEGTGVTGGTGGGGASWWARRGRWSDSGWQQVTRRPSGWGQWGGTGGALLSQVGAPRDVMARWGHGWHW